MEQTLLDPPVATDEEQEEKERPRAFPFELSALIKNVVGNAPVTAINAFDGSLLAAFDPAYRFGLDPNENNRAADGCTYQKVYGDLLKACDLLVKIGQGAEHLIIDLSRDDDWKTPLEVADKLQYDVTTSRVVYRVYVTKREDADKLLALPNFGYGIARISIGDLEEPLAVTFATLRELPELAEGVSLPSRGATVDVLDLLNNWVQEQLSARDRYASPYPISTYGTETRRSNFDAAHKEYGRRYIAKGGQTFDLELIEGKVINVATSSYTNKVLAAMQKGQVTARIHNKHVNHFAQNPGHWMQVEELVEEGILLCTEELIDVATAVVKESMQVTVPLTRPSPAQRLAWLHERTRLKCVKDLDDDFKAGEWYSLDTIEDDEWDPFETDQVDKKTGELQTVKKRDKIRFERFRVGNRRSFRDDRPEDIEAMLEHFDVPDVPDVAQAYPHLVKPQLEILDAIESECIVPQLQKLENAQKAGYRTFQKGDLARLMAKKDGILAWDPGLGKTLGGLTYIEASFRKGAQRCALIIAPKDLIPQTKREAKRFFNWDVEEIGGNLRRRHTDAQKGLSRKDKTSLSTEELNRNEIARVQAIAKRLRNPDEGGIFITSFYDLAQLGRSVNEKDEPHVLATFEEQVWKDSEVIEDPTTPGGWRRIPARWENVTVEMTSAEFCPACVKRVSKNGQVGKDDVSALRWNGVFCTRRVQHPSNKPHRTKSRIRQRNAKGHICGHSVFSKKAPTLASILSTAFRRGVIVVDEGTEISGQSQQSEAVMGMRAEYRLLMTGTPIRNYVGHSFRLLWWTLRGKPDNKRFPYGKFEQAEYERNFTVQRQKLKDGKWVADGTKAGRITNYSRFWRMGASAIIRTRKEDTGEPIVRKKLHVLRAPWGVYQREQHEFYRENFPDLWAEKNPNDPRIKTGAHKRISHLLGLDQKWNWVAVAPECDADFAWSGIPVSNWTPMAYKSLETTLRLVKLGRKVIVGCDLQLGADFLRKALEMKGVRVATTLDDSGQTKSVHGRADDIDEFQNGDAQVLVSTIKSIRLGHNLHAGSAVVFHGLDWQYETFYQFQDRVHRLISERSVDVFVILPGVADESIPGRKWASLEDKTKGVQTAIDGEVAARDEEKISKAQIFREMLEKGIQKTGDEVLEQNVQRAWENLPHVERIEVPESFIERLAAEDDLEDILPTPKTYITPLLTHGMVADSIEAFFAGAIKHASRPKIEAVIQYDEPIGPEWLEPENVEETERNLTLVVNDLMQDLEHDLQEVLAPQDEEPETEPETEPESIDLAPAPTVTTSDLIQNLKELKELLDLGVLEQDEFNEMKGAILAQMKAITTATTEEVAA